MTRAEKQPPSIQGVREVPRDVHTTVWGGIATRLLCGLRSPLKGLLEDRGATRVGGWA
jgi:hypothetical protein